MNLLGKALVFVLLEFVKNQGIECLISVKDDISRCLAQVESSRQQNQRSMIMTDDENYCSDMDALHKCVVAKLESCKSKVPSEITDDFMQKIATKTSWNTTSYIGQGDADESSEYIKQFTQIIQHLITHFKMKCQLGGHNEVMESLENEINRTASCVKGKVDLYNLTEAYSEAVRIGDLPTFFRKSCRVWPDVHGCISPLVSVIEKCQSTEENRANNKTFDLLDYSNSYFCDNNAQRITKFVKTQGFQCLTSVKDDLGFCLLKAISSRQQRVQNQTSLIMTYDDNDCSDINTFHKCVVGKLATCQSKVPSEITDDFMQKIAPKRCNATSYSNVHLGQGGADEPSEYIKQFTPLIQQLINILKMKCQVAEHNDVMESLEEKMRNITSCLHVNVHLQDVDEKYSEAVRIGDLPNFFRKNCKVWHEVHSCISPLFSSIAKCLSTEENRGIDKSIDLIGYSNSYFCNNNSQHIIKFVENQGFQCLTSVKDDLGFCLLKAMSSRQQRVQNQMSSIMTYDDNDCSDIDTLRKCVVGKLATCQSKVPSEITDDFMQKIATQACNGTSYLRPSIKQT